MEIGKEEVKGWSGRVPVREREENTKDSQTVRVGNRLSWEVEGEARIGNNC